MIPWKNISVTDPILVSKTIWVVLKQFYVAGRKIIMIDTEVTDYLTGVATCIERRKKAKNGEKFKLVSRFQGQELDLKSLSLCANFK